MKKKNNLMLFAVLLCCAVCFYAGWTLKPCPVVQVVTTSDTLDVYTPIKSGTDSALPVVTYPKNEIVYVHDTFIKTKYVQRFDTSTILNENTTALFVSNDTLRYDSIYVSIIDTGDCNGILKRHSTFGGKIRERIVNNQTTEITEKKTELFQLYAGVGYNWIGDKYQSVATVLQLGIKQKVLLGYAFHVNTFAQSISIHYKIR